MSVCDEGWRCPYLDWTKPCPMGVTLPSTAFNLTPDSCPFAPILKALPTATPEILAIIKAVLSGAEIKQTASAKKVGMMDIWVITDYCQSPDFKDDTPCPTCGGSGYKFNRPWTGCATNVCPTCHGKGSV